MSHPRATGDEYSCGSAGLHVERPAWPANDGRSRATVRAVGEEATFWSRLTCVSLVRAIRRIAVNKAEDIPVVRLLLENDTVF